MSISILYPKPTLGEQVSYPERTFYHLSIDKVANHICADVKKRKLFTEVLTHPLTTEYEIKFRQDVLKDLYEQPEITEQLDTLFCNFSELYSWQREAKVEKFRMGANKNESLVSAKNLLQVSALTLKRALIFVSEIYKTIDNSHFRSEGMIHLKNSLQEHLHGEEYSRMLEYCSSFEYYKTSGTIDVKVSLDKDGKIGSLDLIEHKYIKITDPDLKKKGISKFFGREESVYPCKRVTPRPSDNTESVFIEAINGLAGIFSRFSDTLFERYLKLEEELTFYKLAIQYIKMINDREIPMAYPCMSDGRGDTCVIGLYDLFLLLSKGNAKSVVPNDVKIDGNSSGILLFGNNGSGKTVFLRSVATMHVLAQAGLPVPAEYAQLPIYKQLVTQFSEGEKEFSEGNCAGRFEQEVREIAYMVDNLEKDSLVFLNETFQTTAYDEGAEGLYNILEFFAKKNIKFICATHLHQLEDKFGDEVTRLYTSNGFKIG